MGLIFKSEDKEFKKHKMLVSFEEVFISSMLMGVVAYVVLNGVSQFFNLNTFWGVFLQGAIAGSLGIVAGLIFLKFRRNKELLEIYEALRKRFWKEEVIAPEPERL